MSRGPESCHWKLRTASFDRRERLLPKGSTSHSDAEESHNQQTQHRLNGEKSSLLKSVSRSFESSPRIATLGEQSIAPTPPRIRESSAAVKPSSLATAATEHSLGAASAEPSASRDEAEADNPTTMSVNNSDNRAISNASAPSQSSTASAANCQSTASNSSPRKDLSVASTKPEKDAAAASAADDFLRIDEIIPYRDSVIRTLLHYALACCTAGIWLLIHHWFHDSLVSVRYSRCERQFDAHLVHVIARIHGNELIRVERVAKQTADERRADGIKDSDDESCELNATAVRSSIDSKDRNQSFSLISSAEAGDRVPLSQRRMIIFRHQRYVLNEATDCFERLPQLATLPCNEVYTRLSSGLSNREADDLLTLRGLNTARVLVPPVSELLVKEVLHPFMIFQGLTVVLWFLEQYYYFAVCVFITATISIGLSLRATLDQLIKLSVMSQFDEPVRVRRDGRTVTISSTQLCIGDIVELQRGAVPTDVVLLQGSAVVDMSSLTGEAIPILIPSIQWPLQPLTSQAQIPVGSASERNILYSATKVLQLKPVALAPGDSPVVLGCVTRTGFDTAKGSLILSILFPQPSTFKFVSQSYKFIGALAVVATVGLIVTIYQLNRLGASRWIMFLRACDLVTIILPPALAIALTIGTTHALYRLRDQLIYCISPSKINIAGKVQLIICDKTGTLTSDGLEFAGVLTATEGRFTGYKSQVFEANSATRHASFDSTAGSQRRSLDAALPNNSDYFEASPECLDVQTLQLMSSCHGLAALNNDGTQVLAGDALDLVIFNATRATFNDEHNLRDYQSIITLPVRNDSVHRSISAPESRNQSVHCFDQTIGILRFFEFTSTLQRMSVIVRIESGADSEMRVFCKGSAEALTKLCVESSLPPDYEKALQTYAQSGLRVIAFATKRIDSIPTLEQDELRSLMERELHFAGFCLLENKVKPETVPAIEALLAARIRCLICTGDHPRTSCSVARTSHIVDPSTRIFLAQFKTPHSTDIDSIEFIDIEPNSTLRLDPLTLRVVQPAHAETFKYELAITGPIFAQLQQMPASSEPNSYFHRVLMACVIFSRMTPQQKGQLVAAYQSMGLYCAACGDGSNDVAMLKAAHVGVSLSETESSIAAPFTYARPNISCLPLLLCEGRATLSVSFAIFRFISMYSIIQFSAVLQAYFVGSVLGNWEYLVQDMLIVFPLCIFLGRTKASHHLGIKRPSGNLLSFANLISITVHAIICIVFQIIIFSQTRAQPDYIQIPNPDNGPDAEESTALYYYSNLQYLLILALFARGSSWLASPLTNRRLTVWFSICLAGCLSMLLIHRMPVDDVPLPFRFRFQIFLIFLLQCCVSTTWDCLLLPLVVRAHKRRMRAGQQLATSLGRVKPIDAESCPTYHRLRGQFEKGWTEQTESDEDQNHSWHLASDRSHKAGPDQDSLGSASQQRAIVTPSKSRQVADSSLVLDELRTDLAESQPKLASSSIT